MSFMQKMYQFISYNGEQLVYIIDALIRAIV